MTRIFAMLCLVATTALCSLTAAADHHHERSRSDIVETAAAAGSFGTLLAAAEAAGLVDALVGEGPLTVFAPTDEAFGTLPAGTIDSLLEPGSRETLARILKFHVVAGRVGSDALADGAALETLAGPRITFAATEQGFTVENARIVTTDIGASNGVIHVIDRVMLPPARMSRRDAGARIDRAIARGVPAFNHGDAATTVQVYADAARDLLANAELRRGERDRLRSGEHARDARASAWALRYALDDVRDSLDSMRMSAL